MPEVLASIFLPKAILVPGVKLADWIDPDGYLIINVNHENLYVLSYTSQLPINYSFLYPLLRFLTFLSGSGSFDMLAITWRTIIIFKQTPKFTSKVLEQFIRAAQIHKLYTKNSEVVNTILNKS